MHEKRSGCPNMLTSRGGPGNNQESLLDLFMYIGQKDNCNTTWEEAVKSNGLVLPTLDGVVTRAIQSTCNMNKSQMRQLRGCLKAELGSTVFSSEFKITHVLGVEHVEPTTGTYKHGKEKIDWSYKPVCQVLELWLKSRTNEGAKQFKCDHLDLVVTIDHGKGHSRVTFNFITRVRSPENGEWDEEEYACTIGNARCRKDNAVIIMNTFGMLLNDELKTLPSSISIVEGQAEFGANAAAEKNIPINLFMAGNILVYNMGIGKVGMSGWWCSYCKLFKNDWQQLRHVRGEPWTIESLTAHAEQIANQEINTKDICAVCSVRGKPVFDTIPLKHFITPVLHLTIGKGNNVLDNFVAELQAAIEGHTDNYYAAEKAEVITKIAQEHAKEELASFNMVMLEYEKDLKRQSKRNTLSYVDRLIVELELGDIVEERSTLQDAVPTTKNEHCEAKKRLQKSRRSRKMGKRLANQ
jgi:hypothetical protein